MKKISIVVSVYNEEKVIKYFYAELISVLNKMQNYKFELLFINDGSIDKSKTILEELSSQNSNVKVINFSKNFGHEAAMIAGIDESSGKFIICMDADLQHPPKAIKDIILKIEEGYEVVNMVRISKRN